MLTSVSMSSHDIIFRSASQQHKIKKGHFTFLTYFITRLLFFLHFSSFSLDTNVTKQHLSDLIAQVVDIIALLCQKMLLYIRVWTTCSTNMVSVSSPRSCASLLEETPIQADFRNCEEANHVPIVFIIGDTCNMQTVWYENFILLLCIMSESPYKSS